jgi:two-component system chemotaxis response regulator CheY
MVGKPPTVLIVEGEPHMRLKLKDIFKSNFPSCTILESSDGIDAVKKFKEFRPELVTMAIDLPHSNGIISLNAILEIDPKAQVIMISSQPQRNLAEDVIKMGAIQYITKPFDRNVVSPILIKALRDSIVRRGEF